MTATSHATSCSRYSMQIMKKLTNDQKRASSETCYIACCFTHAEGLVPPKRLLWIW
jgi:hypothetical protein